MNLDNLLHDPALIGKKKSKMKNRAPRVESTKPVKPIENGFSKLGIAPNLLNAINKLKFVDPTPIQKDSIPIGLEGKDLIALAQTGSGKTMAFGIPMIQRLAKLKFKSGLILVPTRELAIQVVKEIEFLCSLYFAPNNKQLSFRREEESLGNKRDPSTGSG